MNVSAVTDVQNLLIWYIALAPEHQGEEEESVEAASAAAAVADELNTKDGE